MKPLSVKELKFILLKVLTIPFISNTENYGTENTKMFYMLGLTFL